MTNLRISRLCGKSNAACARNKLNIELDAIVKQNQTLKIAIGAIHATIITVKMRIKNATI